MQSPDQHQQSHRHPEEHKRLQEVQRENRLRGLVEAALIIAGATLAIVASAALISFIVR